MNGAQYTAKMSSVKEKKMKIGLTELIVLLIVALVVLGPDKFPKYAGQLGRALREFRKFSSEATKEIRESIVEPLEEAQKPLREAMEPISSLKDELEGNMKELQKSLDDLGNPIKKEDVPGQKIASAQTESFLEETEAETILFDEIVPIEVQAESVKDEEVSETKQEDTRPSEKAQVDNLADE